MIMIMIRSAVVTEKIVTITVTVDGAVDTDISDSDLSTNSVNNVTDNNHFVQFQQ